MGNLINIDIKRIVDNGFLLYLGSGNYIVEKKCVPLNRRDIEKRSFETLEEAVEFIQNSIDSKEWKAIVRYNRGLGIEYKTLKTINALSFEEAKKEALKEAEKVVGEHIIEVKVLENF